MHYTMANVESSSTYETQLNSLPAELLAAVLGHVPMRQLIKCRAVCKLWKESIAHRFACNKSLTLVLKTYIIIPGAKKEDSVWKKNGIHYYEHMMNKKPFFDEEQSHRHENTCPVIVIAFAERNRRPFFPVEMLNFLLELFAHTHRLIVDIHWRRISTQFATRLFEVLNHWSPHLTTLGIAFFEFDLTISRQIYK